MVKRYDCAFDGGDFIGLQGSDDGRVVSYLSFQEMEAKCAALAAENAELNRANAVALNILNDEDTLITSLWASSVHKVVSDTPATDAFLAETRASAVDEACLKISNAIVNCYQDEQVGLDAAATICGDFAAQLRGNSNGGAL